MSEMSESKYLTVLDSKTKQFLPSIDLTQTIAGRILSQQDVSEIIAIKINKDVLSKDDNPDLTQEEREARYLNQLEDQNLIAAMGEKAQCTEVIAANNGTVYLGTPRMASELRDKYFPQEPELCCRYGSLFVSDCRDGLEGMDGKILITDCESKIPQIKQRSLDYQTGDCNGKISREMANKLGNSNSHAFQFRAVSSADQGVMPAFISKGTFLVDDQKTTNAGYQLVLDRSSIKGLGDNEGPLQVLEQQSGDWNIRFKPEISQRFAELRQQGVTQIDPNETEAVWAASLDNHLRQTGIQYEVHQDQSLGAEYQGVVYKLKQPTSQQLDQLSEAYKLGKDRVPLGEVDAKDLTIGAMQSAKLMPYNGSWQFFQWRSEEAIKQDVLPLTEMEAKHLAEIQGDPNKLKDYLIEQWERRESHAQLQQDIADETQGVEEEIQNDTKDAGFIDILKADKLNTLWQHPKTASFAKRELRNRWKHLATKGAVPLQGVMAQPAEIKRGTVIAPHLKNGDIAIIGRYPVVTGDGIRKYIVDNNQAGYERHATKEGCFFINPQDAAKHHQMDFDGDYGVVISGQDYPAMAKEIDWAGPDAPNRFAQVTKRKKVPYSTKNLKQTALSISRNKIGLVTNAMAKVYNAKPHPDATPQVKTAFEQNKEQLMEKLADALQIEVDGPKSALRHEDVYPSLLQDINKNPAFKIDFFAYMKNKDLYLNSPMPQPEQGKECVLDLMTQVVNKHWSSQPIASLPLNHFANVFPKMQTSEYVDQASNILHKYNIDTMSQIFSTNHSEEEKIKMISQQYGIFKEWKQNLGLSPEQSQQLASKVWQKQHKSDASLHRKKGIELCEKYNPPPFSQFLPNHSLAKDLKQQNCYRMEVPYRSTCFQPQSGHTDAPAHFKAMLEGAGIPYEASNSESKPAIAFDIRQKDLPQEWQQYIQAFSGTEFLNAINQIDSRVNPNKEEFLVSRTNGGAKYKMTPTPPREYAGWTINQEKSTAGLSFSVFTEEIQEAVQQADLQKLVVVGYNKNDYGSPEVNIRQNPHYIGKQLEFEVKPMQIADDRDGCAGIYIKDPYVQQDLCLGMVSTDSTIFGIGTTFSGVLGNEGSDFTLTTTEIRLPSASLEESPVRTYTKARERQQRENIRENKREYANRNRNLVRVAEHRPEVKEANQQVQQEEQLEI